MRDRRRTTCTVPGHGCRCEASHNIDPYWSRAAEKRRAMRFEELAWRPSKIENDR